MKKDYLKTTGLALLSVGYLLMLTPDNKWLSNTGFISIYLGIFLLSIWGFMWVRKWYFKNDNT